MALVAILLCFYCIQPSALSANGISEAESLLNILQREWSQYSASRTSETFADCLDTTQDQHGWYIGDIRSHKLLFSPVCDRKLRIESLVSFKTGYIYYS